jgi:serine protease Do
VTNARRLILALAASAIFAVPALAEELECRWFIPALGRTVPVRCGDAAPQISPPAAQQARPETELLGLTLAPLSQGLKDEYGIEKGINGVAVTQVDVNSEAAGRGIARGDVILQTNQDVVSIPEDMVRSVESATKEGRKAISLLLSNGQGKTQLISLSLGI